MAERQTTEHFADRLLEAIEQKGSPVCVGLDPVYERLPDVFGGEAETPQQRVEAIGRFCREVLGVVAPIVPAVKLQIAYFERYRDRGLRLYFELVACARQLGLIVIGDVKRGDIASTAQAYADTHLLGTDAPDAITVNGYFGADGLEPFVRLCRAEGRGLFVLVRTSNASAAQIQDFSDGAGKKFYEHVAEQVAACGGGGLLGRRGYSCLGAVVAATYPDEARRLRQIMPQQIFLVPGYGAQGASAADCTAAFKPDGAGAVVNASRSIIFAHEKANRGGDWKRAVEDAAKAFADDIRNALP
ncbi:MAG: orotidine-5'-phosphate decarboxylase [Planctomycetota bacterium]|nr:orotidine-5'-phosphate decarboxylase [Planctomycetota bacterium]